ncbi:MAG: 3-phosphoshikimate 1-carboxyvinyltransferase [Clostridia bacterium]|nr:3-phosphoshikimate 1-carboxyvinyltransferase [Clostridia bacterium]
MKACFHPTPGAKNRSVAVDAPPSKTLAHRELLAASLADGESFLRGLTLSEDIAATIDCIRALGARVELTDGERPDARVIPHAAPPASVLPCRESGSTLRFVLPLCLLDGMPRLLTGSERLLSRPLGVYEDLCRERGLTFTRTDKGVSVSGPLLPGEFTVRGDVSSQFITGLLIALPKLGGRSRLRILPPLVSRPYLDVTLAVLEKFGVRIEREDETTFCIEGNQVFRPADLTVEGDFSNAAYLDAFRLFGWNVTVGNLPEVSAQGDRVYREYFEAIKNGCPTIDVTDTPDLAPVLMTLGAAAHGVHLTGTSRLKLKESDRGDAMAEELAKFGAAVEMEEDRIYVPPALLHAPCAPLDSHNDHRVVMALSLLCAEYGGEIKGAEAVNKSYPDYFDALRTLGVGVEMRET